MIGSKHGAEDEDDLLRANHGRGAFLQDRSRRVTDGGHAGSDYADMSNEKPGENPGRRNSKVSRGRFVRPGLAGA